MRVLILGANGMMGPWVSKFLKKDQEIIETDLVKIDSNINFYNFRQNLDFKNFNLKNSYFITDINIKMCLNLLK